MEFPDVVFSRSNWAWREVVAQFSTGDAIGYMVQTKLLHIRETGEALYYGNGDELLCRILDRHNFGGRILYRRRNTKDDFALVRRMKLISGIFSARLVGDGFSHIASSDSAAGQEHYFMRGGETLRAKRIDVAVEGEVNPVPVLQLVLPDGMDAEVAFEIPKIILEKVAKRMFPALVGETRSAVRFTHADENGRYQFSRALSEVVAVKVVVHALGAIPASARDLDPQFRGQRENPMTEIKAMDFIARTPNGTPGTFGHPNIMRLLDVLADERFVFVVLPFMAGRDICVRPIRLDLETMRECVTQIASAIAFLHALGICHCDITLENVLVDTVTSFARGVSRVVLCDFGQARWHPMGPFQLLPPTGDPDRCPPGKIAYFCPENTHSIPYSGFKVDIWQFGILVVQMCTQSPPFVKRPKRKAEDSAQDVPEGTFLDAPDGTLLRWQDMVRQRQHPQTRMQTRTNVGIKSPFWAELFDIAVRALHIDPQQRPTIADLCPGAIVAALLPTVDPAHLQPQQAPLTPQPLAAAAVGGVDGGEEGGGVGGGGGGEG